MCGVKLLNKLHSEGDNKAVIYSEGFKGYG